MSDLSKRQGLSILRSVADNVWTALAMILICVGLLMVLTPMPELYGDPIEGLTLYQSNCTACHAKDGSGGIRVGRAMSADIRWSALAPALGTDGLIRQALLFGVDDKGNQLGIEMPRFRGQLIDAEIDNIVAFLQTLSAPKTQ